MASGRINLQSNDGKVAGIVFEDGASSNVTVTIPKEGGVLATQTGLDTAMSTINASVPAAYHIYNGQLALANTVTTTGFSTTLYTGNGATQSITTGIDMDTQWGNDASEKFGGLVWIKERNSTHDHNLLDTVRGVGKAVWSSLTAQQYDYGTTNLTSFNSNGFSVGSGGVQVNTLNSTYASWNFQTTHRVSGTTNHGKAFTCHYNPYTGFTIVKYEGSGITGHEIPHHLGRKLGFVTVKATSTSSEWVAQYSINPLSILVLNITAAEGLTGGNNSIDKQDNASILGTGTVVNASTATYIMYGWANSYFDEANKLIGNYEVGVYQGTGASGNKVTTRGKPAWVMIKRLDSTSNWVMWDNTRDSGELDLRMNANLSEAEHPQTDMTITFQADGFTQLDTHAYSNASGGQYLYMVVYDNDSGSGKSKYPRATDTSTLNLNAHVPFANGIDTTGSKVSIAYKNETITLSNALTQGKNYIALLNDGSYVATATKPSYGLINPSSGDFFNLDTQKWYSNLNVEITPRNYLDCIVYADQNGQPEFVEQIEKVQYFDAVKANDYRGKNVCTAWVNFDGTTTPPTIKDSYNVSAIIRTATGIFDIYFTENMDSINYAISGSCNYSFDDTDNGAVCALMLGRTKSANTIGKCRVITSYNGTLLNSPFTSVKIFGGKN